MVNLRILMRRVPWWAQCNHKGPSEKEAGESEADTEGDREGTE